MKFQPGFDDQRHPERTDFCFLFREQRLLVKKTVDGFEIPASSDLEALGLPADAARFFGTIDGTACFMREAPEALEPNLDYRFIGLRGLFGGFEESQIRASGMANQLIQWHKNHRYCGSCGKPTEPKAEERAKFCPGCGLTMYPRLSPAVIVAVTREDRILLANAQRFPARFYSVLAGFVEPGESLEGCVKREIQEEVGIAVKNIRYFGSQPWPFPDSLMIAFTAEYASGEIQVDPDEIHDAGWFTADRLPPIPPRISIARRLIDWFVADRVF